MAAKRVRLSIDNGSTWRTLPGNQGSITNEAGELDDTIFGQNFKSSQPGLIGWSVNANGLYKGFAGYVCKIMQQTGSVVVITDEAMSLVSGKTYQITNAAHRLLDMSTAVVVEDNGVAVSTANIESIDYLFGRVTFISSYTPTGPITITGGYFATVQVAGTRSFTLTMTAADVDDTTMPSAQASSGHRQRHLGLRTASLELGGVYALSNGFRAALVARSRLLVEINPDGNSKSVARGWFRYTQQGSSGNVGALEEETVTLTLAVPDENDLLLAPFYWRNTTDTTLNQALRDAIDAWQSGAEIDVQYLPDGTNGVKGKCVISSCTLTGGLEAMNAFAIVALGNNALSAVP